MERPEIDVAHRRGLLDMQTMHRGFRMGVERNWRGSGMIRPYDPNDEEAVAGLVSQLWGRDWAGGRCPRYGPDADEPSFLRTVVAESGGRVIGFGTIWAAPMYPHTLYAAVGVEPAQQGRGFGRRLMGRLLDLRGSLDYLRMQTAIWDMNDRGARFLARHGFTPVRRTWMPVLPVTSEGLGKSHKIHHMHAVLIERCRRPGHRICSLSELGGDPLRDRKVAALCAEIYTATHTINPPAAMDLAAWQDLIFVEDPVVEEGSFVAMRGADLAGIALLHPGAEPAILELGWRGVTKEHRRWSRSLVLALTLEQVRYAMERGCDLLAEVDSTDPWAMLMHTALPFRPAPAWVTWQRRAQPQVRWGSAVPGIR